MRIAFRVLQAWMLPLLVQEQEAERQTALRVLHLDRACATTPSLLRLLSDRSVSVEKRLSWLKETLTLSSGDVLADCFRRMLEQNGFSTWSRFFYEYLRLRERLGLGRLCVVRTALPLGEEQQADLETSLEKRFSEPVILAPTVDASVGAGVRLQSPDGWTFDASLEGRLSRLATALAT